MISRSVSSAVVVLFAVVFSAQAHGQIFPVKCTPGDPKCRCVIPQGGYKRIPKKDVYALKHTLTATDTLATLSQLYYGNESAVLEIASFNGMTNPTQLPRAGTVLEIPCRLNIKTPTTPN